MAGRDNAKRCGGHYLARGMTEAEYVQVLPESSAIMTWRAEILGKEVQKASYSNLAATICCDVATVSGGCTAD
jgi:hypothetical protein